MSDHQDKADAVEAEIDGLEQESEQLDQRIGETRADWERRKGDEKVPGADDAGGYASADDEGPPPETSAASGGEPEHREE